MRGCCRVRYLTGEGSIVWAKRALFDINCIELPWLMNKLPRLLYHIRDLGEGNVMEGVFFSNRRKGRTSVRRIIEFMRSVSSLAQRLS